LQSKEFKEYQRRWQQSPKWKAYQKEYRNSHKEEQRLYQKWYRQTAKGKAIAVASAQRRRAIKALSEGSYTAQQWLDLKMQYKCRCLCCGRHESYLPTVLEQDHIIPLTKGGSNWISNIQPLCADCNGPSGKWQKTTDYRKMPHRLCVEGAFNGTA
jgi:5-methylcytosine-specific restriction endonuclease McrA